MPGAQGLEEADVLCSWWVLSCGVSRPLHGSLFLTFLRAEPNEQGCLEGESAGRGGRSSGSGV